MAHLILGNLRLTSGVQPEAVQEVRNNLPSAVIQLDEQKEQYMDMVGAMSQFLIVLNSNQFAAVVLIALVAVANRRPPKD
jgi:hypothetical protein